ncbi:hypothetical protein NDU88_003474 [Pleurodeles waltl]|uniref:Uncharacterized protein n=1 Tax=Pleurodeles waltl TaxID=8319 RepID=A0AAV7T5K2_PLEWA|nr:hypothetical protein NDU88_003474 [Pleurodeles waltl]
MQRWLDVLAGSETGRGTRRETPALGTCCARTPPGAKRLGEDSPSGESGQSQHQQGSWEGVSGAWKRVYVNVDNLPSVLYLEKILVDKAIGGVPAGSEVELVDIKCLKHRISWKSQLCCDIQGSQRRSRGNSDQLTSKDQAQEGVCRGEMLIGISADEVLYIQTYSLSLKLGFIQQANQ